MLVAQQYAGAFKDKCLNKFSDCKESKKIVCLVAKIAALFKLFLELDHSVTIAPQKFNSTQLFL